MQWYNNRGEKDWIYSHSLECEGRECASDDDCVEQVPDVPAVRAGVQNKPNINYLKTEGKRKRV